MNTPKIFSVEQVDTSSQQLKITKRKRPNQPKTRTGCITCKIRRIKCDEQKPSCSKCLSTGRACDGYRTPKTLLFEICQDEREKRSFHYFRENTANQVCSQVDVSFWKGFVLRAGHHSEAVRHALAGVGSFHESLELETGPKAVAARCFAFEQYGKALEMLGRPGSLETISPILATCVLVIWLENLQGHFSIALQHLRSGLQLLTSVKTGSGSSCVDPDLVRMLLCLGSQASRFLGPPNAETSACGPTLPDVFLDVSEAHEYFYRIIHWICSELEDKEKVEKRQWRTGDSISKLAAPLRRWQIQLKECVDRVGLNNKPASSTDLQHACHLETQCKVAMIMLHAVPLDNEMLFDDDEQLERFADIVLLSQQALKLKTIANPRSVDYETNIIPPLLMTACRCRDPIIRRKAIAVLRSYDWRETIFWSKQTANICERLMIQEETGLGNVGSCRDVPSSNRLYLSYCTFYGYSPESKKLELRDSISDPPWTRLHCARSNCDPAVHGLEIFWLRHNGPNLVDEPGVFLQDVGGLFRQHRKSNTKLWTILQSGNAVRSIARFGSPSVFRAHARRTSLKGDFITLAGHFSEYLTTDQVSFVADSARDSHWTSHSAVLLQ